MLYLSYFNVMIPPEQPLHLAAILHSEGLSTSPINKVSGKRNRHCIFPMDSHPNCSGGQNYFPDTFTEERKYHG